MINEIIKYHQVILTPIIKFKLRVSLSSKGGGGLCVLRDNCWPQNYTNFIEGRTENKWGKGEVSQI